MEKRNSKKKWSVPKLLGLTSKSTNSGSVLGTESVVTTTTGTPRTVTFHVPGTAFSTTYTNDVNSHFS